MKKIISSGLLLLSINVYSQSYLVLSNGVTLTTDKAGFVYDFRHFRLPYKVDINGGQFLVENEKLSTVDKNGFLYEKDFEVKKIRGKGLNYFIQSNNHLVTIDSDGFYYEFDQGQKDFRRSVIYGGNYFVIHAGGSNFDLYTVNSKGNYFKIEVDGLNPRDIVGSSGNYFQTRRRIMYTVSSEGFVFAKPDVYAGYIVKSGGNFFIDSENKLYTVADSGLLLNPVLPTSLVISDIKKTGANYMIDSQGRIFTVDSQGNINERVVNHDLTGVKIISH